MGTQSLRRLLLTGRDFLPVHHLRADMPDPERVAVAPGANHTADTDAARKEELFLISLGAK